ncbi:MAG TPA: hypothetical protein VN700_14470, partial [Vicinamibacterales bacterium]|nr:hypothetical protein [Vicinamibacterales bacterium]
SSLEIAFFEARRKMRTLNAVVATGTDQPPATTAKIKTVSHTKIGTRPRVIASAGKRFLNGFPTGRTRHDVESSVAYARPAKSPSWDLSDPA